MLVELVFLYKIERCNNSIMNFLFEVFGKYDLQILLTKYNITGLCSPRRFRLFACTRISCVSFSFFFFTFIVYFFFFLVFCMFVCFVFAAAMAK